MSKQKKYSRLDKAERAAIERGLDAKRSCRQIAKDLGRSPSSVAAEVKANRTVAKGAGKGERASSVPESACPKLLAWPHVCNGCKYRRYHCSRKWRCEYSAARAQALSDELLSAARRGVDRDQHEFEAMMEAADGRCKIKGAGGIRDREKFLRLIDMGIDRMGIGFKSTASCIIPGRSTRFASFLS